MKRLLLAVLLCPVAVLARQPGVLDKPTLDRAPPQGEATAMLPEGLGIVSWKTLAQVEMVKIKDKMVPQYSDNISALDRKEVKVQGYMMPLELGEKQKRFLLSASAPTCAYCLPGGPDSVVEVLAKQPIRYGLEPVVVSGTLTVLKSDPTGMFYRMSDAVLVPR
jgi:hypothetical protein